MYFLIMFKLEVVATLLIIINNPLLSDQKETFSSHIKPRFTFLA